MQVDYNTT